jgi:hypothetical protein
LHALYFEDDEMMSLASVQALVDWYKSAPSTLERWRVARGGDGPLAAIYPNHLSHRSHRLDVKDRSLSIVTPSVQALARRATQPAMDRADCSL